MINWLPFLDVAGKHPVWSLCILPALYILMNMSLIFFGGLGSTSATVLPGVFSSSDCVFSFDFVNLTPWGCCFHMTFLSFIGVWRVFLNRRCCKTWPRYEVSCFDCIHPCLFDWESCSCMEVCYCLWNRW
jgi:hypothetical protein